MINALHDIADYKLHLRQQRFFLLYVFGTLSYLGINLALLGLNFRDQDFIEEHYYAPFHLLEFWAVCLFTVVEAFVLISSGTLRINGGLMNAVQVGLALFDILFTLIIAIIFSMYPEEYEVPAHWMEYSAQVFICLVNFVFIFNFWKNPGNQGLVFYKYRYVEVVLAVITFILSIIQFLVYGEVIETAPGGERTAHFFEFVTESMNASFVLWYAILSYKIGDKRASDHYERMHDFEKTLNTANADDLKPNRPEANTYQTIKT